jgi:hypothetical protein
VVLVRIRKKEQTVDLMMRIHQHWHHPNSYAQTLFHCSQEHLIAFNLKKNNAAGLDHSGQQNMLYTFQESA